MLTIQHDPAGISGRERHAWDFSLTIQENVERHLASGFECDAYLNGQRVDPVADPRFDAPPSVADELFVVRRPATGVEIAYLVASLAVAVYSYSQARRGLDEPVVNESQNNKLTAQTNIARAYQAIPDVYGSRRVWPDLLQPSVEEYVNNVKVVTEWLCVSRGYGLVDNAKYADTPLILTDGADYQVFRPEPTPNALREFNPTILQNVVEAFKSPEVDGQELTAAQAYKVIAAPVVAAATVSPSPNITLSFADGDAWAQIKAAVPVAATVRLYRLFGGDTFDQTRSCTITSFSVASGVITLTITPATAFSTFSLPMSCRIQPTGIAAFNTVGPFTLPIDDAEFIRWNTVFLRGLKASVQIKAEWWKITAAGTEISGTRDSYTEVYAANTFDQVGFTSEVKPGAGPGLYQVEFTRQNTPTSDGTDVAKLEALFGVRKYPTKTLPVGITAVRVTTRATKEATGIRERRFNVRFQRWVSTLTSATISQSRNFARAMAHVWRLAGEDIAGLDTTTLAAINAAIGEDSPLLRFDGSLDDANVSLGERLQRIAYSARCTLWRDGDQWTVTRDEARTTPVLQLDYRNLASAGDSTISYSAHLPASNDGVEIEYVDETTQATKAYIRKVITSGTPVAGSPNNPLKIQLPGCTTTEQAEDRAELEARRLLYQRTSVSDQVLADGGMLGLGSLVRWVDPNDFAGDDGLQAGEVLAFSGSTVTLSEPVDFRGEANARILFTGLDGAYLGAAVLCTPGAAANQVLLSSVPSYLSTGIFVRDGTTAQAGSRYAFGPGLSDAEISSAGLYVVTEVKPRADRTFDIGLVNYDARMYSTSPEVVAAASAARIIIGNGFEDGDAPLPGGVVDATGGVGETPMPTWEPPENPGVSLFLYDSSFVPLPNGTSLTSATYASLPGNTAPFLGRVVFYIPLEVGETYTVTDTAGGYAIPGTAKVTTSNGRVYQLDIEGAGATSVGTAQRTS